MFTLLLALACDLDESASTEPTPEYGDAEDIPTPSQDLDDQGSDGGDDGNGGDDGADDSGDEPPAGPSTWLFSEAESLLYLQVWKDPEAWASSMAHDHVIRAGVWEGTLTYDPDDLSTCSLDVSLAVSELVVDESGMRDLVGYGDTIDSADRDEIRENMLSSDQLDGARHPDIWFASTGCAGDGGAGGSLIISGELSARGQISQVQIPLEFSVQGDAFYASGGFTLDHGDFGMTPYEAYWGAVRNDDALGFGFDMVGARQ